MTIFSKIALSAIAGLATPALGDYVLPVPNLNSSGQVVFPGRRALSPTTTDVHLGSRHGALAFNRDGVPFSSPQFDAIDYGAIGDDRKNNDSAFQNLLSAALASDTPSIHIPCGTFYVTSAIKGAIAANKTLAIHGDGQDCTIIRAAAGTHWLSLVMGNQFSHLSVSDLTVETDDKSGLYSAISVSMPTAVIYGSATGAQTVSVRNVTLRGSDSYLAGTQYWGTGWDFTNVSNIDIGGNSAYWGANQSGSLAVTIGSPAVMKMANNFAELQPITISTTGALPNGIAAGRIYYVLNPTSTTFNLSATPGGSAIAASGLQSGTHTATALGFGTAISFKGLTSPASYATVLNIHSLQVYNCRQMLYQGDYAQGITVDGGTNATFCSFGVNVLDTPVGTPDQLLITHSQFNTYVAGVHAIAMNGLMVDYNLFIVAGGTGIVGAGNDFSISHNFIQNSSASLHSADHTSGITLLKSEYSGGSIDHNNIDQIYLPISVPIGSYAAVNIDTNNIQGAGPVWYFVNSVAIGVRISDPSAFKVSDLNTKFSCNAATAGSKTVVDDAASLTYGEPLRGGGTQYAEALCNGISWRAH